MSTNFGLIVLLIALVLGSVALGGGIYETILVDRVWPANLAMIQPARGGLNRKIFWMIVHSPYELALIAGAWLNWSFSAARPWLILALVAHFAARAWSFAYFIPQELRFEGLNELTDDQRSQAQRWVALSRARPLIETVAIVALGVVIFLEAGTAH